MRGGAASQSTTASDSCPTAGGTFETRLVSGERSVCERLHKMHCNKGNLHYSHRGEIDLSQQQVNRTVRNRNLRCFEGKNEQ